MSARLGILGGMFDPVHLGHVAAAQFAVEALELDQLKMIPCHIPNHRENLQIPAEHRLAMLHASTRNDAKIVVDDCEIQRGGVSYAVETVQSIKGSECWDHIVYVMGMDTFNGLLDWHQWQLFLANCHVFVLGRKHQQVDDQVSELLDLDQRLVFNPVDLFKQPAGLIYLAREFEMELSSTEVRKLLVEGEDVAGLVDGRVLDYISAYSLYGWKSEAH